MVVRGVGGEDPGTPGGSRDPRRIQAERTNVHKCTVTAAAASPRLSFESVSGFGDFMWFVTSNRISVSQGYKRFSRVEGFPFVVIFMHIISWAGPALQKRKGPRSPVVPTDLCKCHMCTLCCLSAHFSTQMSKSTHGGSLQKSAEQSSVGTPL